MKYKLYELRMIDCERDEAVARVRDLNCDCLFVGLVGWLCGVLCGLN